MEMDRQVCGVIARVELSFPKRLKALTKKKESGSAVARTNKKRQNKNAIYFQILFTVN